MDIVAGTDRHPVPGETVAGQSLAYYPGGKGANQAVAAAQLGASARMVGRLGDDAFAEDLREFLSNKKVDVSEVSVAEGQPSGTALIVVAGGENTIVVVPGANGTLESESIDGLDLAEGDVLLAQFETPQATTRALFERGRRAGAVNVLNPAPAAEFEKGLLEACDIVVVNESELAAVAGLQSPPSADDHVAIRAAIDSVRVSPAQSWIVTLGASGALAVIAGSNEPTTCPGHEVRAIDTTGAGDCFVGALAAGLSESGNLAESLVLANAAAALSVQKDGAGPSMPASREVDEFLALESRAA